MKRLFFFIALGFFSYSCSQKDAAEGIVFAKVGAEILTIEYAKTQIPDLVFQSDSVKALSDFREEWINKQLILQEIDRLNLSDLPEIQAKVKRAQNDALLAGFQESVSSASSDIGVSTEEARNYYQANKEQFLLNQRYIRFRHLIASNQSDAQNAKRDLMRGIAWNDVANSYSVNPLNQIRNSERFWPASSALAEYEVLNRYLGLIGVSEISIIENIGGRYHFVQLMEQRSEGEHPELEWLIEQIRQWLILEKKRIAYNTYVKNLYLTAQANNEIQMFDVLPLENNSRSNNDSLNSN